jgi:chromate transport protein ChrA
MITTLAFLYEWGEDPYAEKSMDPVLFIVITLVISVVWYVIAKFLNKERDASFIVCLVITFIVLSILTWKLGCSPGFVDMIREAAGR